MINNIASSRLHVADFASVRQNRPKQQAESTPAAAVDKTKTQKPAHLPPGLARAADRIASKIFARADADGSGTVTQQELGAIHSRHARNLGSSDLFKPANTPETTATTTSVTPSSTTEGASPVEENSTEGASPTEPGVSEAQLKEALTKMFYAKVGATYTAPLPPAVEEPTATPPADTNTDSGTDLNSSVSSQTFTAVA